jgi:hypothetical protein
MRPRCVKRESGVYAEDEVFRTARARSDASVWCDRLDFEDGFCRSVSCTKHLSRVRLHEIEATMKLQECNLLHPRNDYVPSCRLSQCVRVCGLGGPRQLAGSSGEGQHTLNAVVSTVLCRRSAAACQSFALAAGTLAIAAVRARGHTRHLICGFIQVHPSMAPVGRRARPPPPIQSL